VKNNLSNIISFNSGSNDETLLSWSSFHKNNIELRSLFFNLDCALKYIHDHGYSVADFSPSEICILNGDEKYIRFKKIIKMSEDSRQRESAIKADIFHSAFLQIAMYCNMLNCLTPQFLKEKFEEIVLFLPQEDVNYYRGVIERNASVYLHEYCQEYFRRNMASFIENSDDANEINEVLQRNLYNNTLVYKEFNIYQNAAFVHFLIVPTIVFGFLFLFSIVCWIISVFSF